MSNQDCEDESEGDGRKRERSLMLLASLASDALDAVSGITKVQYGVVSSSCSGLWVALANLVCPVSTYVRSLFSELWPLDVSLLVVNLSPSFFYPSVAGRKRRCLSTS